MDPRKVDVNVHPAKLEVRFEDESLIYKAVYHAIKSGLEDVKPAIIHETEDVKTDVKTELEDSKTIEKIQEKEFSIEEKKNFEPKFELEEDIVQPKMRTGFTDLLKKVIRNGDSKREEFIQDNVVEAIFEERKGKKRATPDFEEFDNDEEIEKKQNKIDLEKKEDEKRTIYNSNFKFIKETYDDENMVPKKEFEESDIIFNKKIKENDLEKNNDNTKESEDKNVEKIEQNKNPEEIIKKENNIIEDVNEENESSPEKSIKFGNVSIVSETSSATMNFEEFIKEEKRLEETEVINEDFKEISKEEKIEDITKKEESINENKNSTSEIDELTEFIVKNKIDNSIEPTQILDTNKIRDKLPNIEESDTSDVSPEFAEMYKKTFGKDITKKSEEKDNIVETYNDFLYSNTNENLNVFDREDDYIPERKYRFIGIVFDSFLIIEINNEMYIIDQRLAYERIIYDRIKDNYYNEEKKDSQILLLPDIISLNKKQIAIANENIEMFERAGFGFEEFGANTLKLYAVPGLCEKLNTKQLFIDILDSLDSVSIISKEEKEEKFISTISHKSAIKSKLNLEERELIQVLNELLSLKEPFICADNKQIAIKMTKVDFERKFSRR